MVLMTLMILQHQNINAEGYEYWANAAVRFSKAERLTFFVQQVCWESMQNCFCHKCDTLTKIKFTKLQNS